MTTQHHLRPPRASRVTTSLATLVIVSSALFPITNHASEADAIESLSRKFPSARILDVKPKGFGSRKRYQVDYTIGDNQYRAMVANNGDLLEINAAEFDDSNLILGILVRSDSAIYEGGKSETQALPLLWYDNGKFYFKGKSLGYRFYKGWADVSLDLDVGIGDGYDIDENKLLSDMPDLDTSLDFGVLVEKELGDYELSLAVRTDINSAHEGTTAEIEFAREFEISDRWQLELGANVTYRDSNYNDYYYGVDPQYALATRPSYIADSDIETGVEIEVIGQISDNWFTILQLEYTAFGNEVTDSPLVNKDNETEVTFGIGYRF